MIFCQACGARNTGEARFCNMCGARIASTGEPGGPIVPGGTETQSERPAPTTKPVPIPGGTTSAGTTTTMSGSRVSLEAIGVRSSGRTYAILAGAALALLALGALGMWIAMRGGDEAPAVAPGDAEGEEDTAADESAGDELVLGDPIPVGEGMPEGVDIVTTGPRATKRGTSGGASTRPTGTTPRETGGSGTTGTSGTGGGAVVGSGSGSGAGAGSGAVTGTIDTTPGTGTGSGGTSTRDWAAMEEDAPDERDLAMEGYSTHVRRVIREFYIRRAQTCFDHESRRDGEAVRGTVVIGFTIQQSGEVANTTIDRNTTGREALGACLARQVDAWRLPPPPTEMGDVDMQMPFSR